LTKQSSQCSIPRIFQNVTTQFSNQFSKLDDATLEAEVVDEIH